MIDSHMHLNISPLWESHDRVWQQAVTTGITQAVCVGVDTESSQRAIQIAQKLDGVYATVGIHPDVEDPQTETLEKLARSHKVVAIGECGLDYTQPQFDKNKQKRLFGAHVQLAKELGLPLSIHCRDTKLNFHAYSDLLDTLKHFSTSDGNVPAFVLHCMSGNLAYLQEGLALGGFVSFAGNVTYASSGSIRELLHATPLDRLLLETDAPFLSPQSKRGTPNTPANIYETYEFVARELKISFEELEIITTQNFKTLFHIESQDRL